MRSARSQAPPTMVVNTRSLAELSYRSPSLGNRADAGASPAVQLPVWSQNREWSGDAHRVLGPQTLIYDVSDTQKK